MKSFLDGRVILHHGDNREVLRGMADNSVDSFVTDPPYALVSIVKRFGAADAAACKVPEGGRGAYARASKGFMGKQWDTGDTVHAVEFWREVYRVLKPGGHVAAFNGTRTQHRMVCAIEDAGFEIRDMLAWLYGTGFPKSHDVSKGIDKAAGAVREVTGVAGRSGSARSCMAGDFTGGEYMATSPSTVAAQQWEGWGTALKPALEPICLARKPLIGTVAANVLEHGTGAINIDGCRVGTEVRINPPAANAAGGNSLMMSTRGMPQDADGTVAVGRWPANVITDGSEEVIGMFPAKAGANGGKGKFKQHKWMPGEPETEQNIDRDKGSAARFFYSAKANKRDRAESKHPTVKPVALMRWLARLITPPGGTLVDPFAGSGTTGEAAYLEGFNAILIEREDEYVADIERRLSGLATDNTPEPANDNNQADMFSVITGAAAAATEVAA